MIPQAIARQIAESFPALPDRMKRVGRYVLEHPADVALLTMREQARRAGVPPAAMTRFAQRLGFSGYDALRDLFAASMRGRVSDFGVRAGQLAARRAELGEATLAQTLARALVDRVTLLAEPERLSAMVEAAGLLGQARHVFCVGHRSCYAPAFHFAYLAGLHGTPTRLLDAPGGVGFDGLNGAEAGDVLLAFSFTPYTRVTVEAAESARVLGLGLVAVTDSALSPLARQARCAVIVPADLTGATQVASPAFAAAELLAALVVARSGPEGQAVLERNEAEFARRGVYWNDASRRAP